MKERNRILHSLPGSIRRIWKEFVLILFCNQSQHDPDFAVAVKILSSSLVDLVVLSKEFSSHLEKLSFSSTALWTMNFSKFLRIAPSERPSKLAEFSVKQINKPLWGPSSSFHLASPEDLHTASVAHFLCGNGHRPLWGRCPLTTKLTLNSTLMKLVRQRESLTM